MKEKRKYEKPSMRVFELKQRQQLLVGSSPAGVRASRSSYGEANEGMSEGADVWE